MAETLTEERDLARVDTPDREEAAILSHVGDLDSRSLLGRSQQDVVTIKRPFKEVLVGQALLLVSAAMWGSYAPLTAMAVSVARGTHPFCHDRSAVCHSHPHHLHLAPSDVPQPSQAAKEGCKAGAEEKGAGWPPRLASGGWPALSSNAVPSDVSGPYGSWTCVIGGLELAVWGIFGNIGTVVGLKHSTTVRGAFLLRLSSLFTPLIEVGLGSRIGAPVWIACLAAAGGAQ
ncbi:hypothetical protein WJX84_001819 [Apatococcus fuscideae]|uniref:Uncharacterized protein n=1 Tax=Apatococcus fuscideae TaxID=2026836 RepID=A0AAW1SLV9_9CHLO